MSPAPTTRFPLTATLALVGIGLYVIINVIAQLLPPHYSPVSQFESDLGVGEYGWLMGIGFMVRGLIGVATIFTIIPLTVRSTRRTVGLAFLWGWSIASALLGVFPTDITDAATAAGNTGPTFHGLMHAALAGVAFLFVIVACIVLSGVVKFRGSLWIGILAAVCLVLQGATAPIHLAGLAERAFIALILLWQALAVIVLGRRATAGTTSSVDAAGARASVDAPSAPVTD